VSLKHEQRQVAIVAIMGVVKRKCLLAIGSIVGVVEIQSV
jgi:hypothetical protein